jgi:hypothetical protein
LIQVSIFYVSPEKEKGEGEVEEEKGDEEEEEEEEEEERSSISEISTLEILEHQPGSVHQLI